MFRRIPWLNTATNFVLLRSLSCAVLLLTAAVVWIRIDTHIPENQPAVYLEMGTQAHLNIPPICWFCAFGLVAYQSIYTEKIVFYIHQHRVEMSKQNSASNTLLYIFHNKDHLYPKRRIWSLLKNCQMVIGWWIRLPVEHYFWKIAGSDILMHLIKILPKCQTLVHVQYRILRFILIKSNSM